MSRLRTRLSNPRSPLRTAWARLRHHLETRLTPVLGPWSDPRIDGKLRLLRLAPLLPEHLQRFKAPRPWPRPSQEVPDELRGVPGIERDPAAEQAAFDERPFHHFVDVHSEAGEYAVKNGWEYIIASAPRLLRAKKRVTEVAHEAPRKTGRSADPKALTELIRSRARELDISAVGFAPHDPRYTFAPYAGQQEPSMIVVVVEQDHAATQTAPSVRAERAAFRAYAEGDEKAAELAAFVQGLGFRARPHGYLGEGVVISYAVQAGLGQLGLNGQLLTPQAGSRARLGLIATDAPVVHGEPVDFGVNKVCDACQICVRRCPPGAIPKTRKQFRGVVKAKIKPERCFPVLAQTHGCAVCMKVCPVQKWGLDAVRNHLAETGEIPGKGTSELEGYRWPLDGRFYGPAEKPKITKELLDPPGWKFDKTRTAPLDASKVRASLIKLPDGDILGPNDQTVV